MATNKNANYLLPTYVLRGHPLNDDCLMQWPIYSNGGQPKRYLHVTHLGLIPTTAQRRMTTVVLNQQHART